MDLLKIAIKIGKYRHYKGKEYEVLGLAKHSETSEDLVIYRELYDEKKLWARPLEMFKAKVIFEGNIKSRFEYLGK